MDTIILEEQIQKYQSMITDREKKIDFLKIQQKEDQAILKQMEKSLQRLMGMTRNAFLATIAAIFTAPFVKKAESAMIHGNSNQTLKIYVGDKEIAECKPYTFTPNRENV